MPVIGARRRDQLAEILGALALRLDAADLHRIEAAVSPDLTAGARYAPAQMAHLDSEFAFVGRALPWSGLRPFRCALHSP